MVATASTEHSYWLALAFVETTITILGTAAIAHHEYWLVATHLILGQKVMRSHSAKHIRQSSGWREFAPLPSVNHLVRI